MRLEDLEFLDLILEVLNSILDFFPDFTILGLIKLPATESIDLHDIIIFLPQGRLPQAVQGGERCEHALGLAVTWGALDLGEEVVEEGWVQGAEH